MTPPGADRPDNAAACPALSLDRQHAVNQAEGETAAGEAFTRLALLVFRVNGRLLAAGDRLAAPVGQTAARWQVMGVIDHGPLTVAAVARRMGLRRQSVQRTADLLVAAGVAAYVDNPTDKRARLLALTSSGRRALRRIEAAQRTWARELGATVGAEGLEAAIEVLERVEELLACAEDSSRRSRRDRAR